MRLAMIIGPGAGPSRGQSIEALVRALGASGHDIRVYEDRAAAAKRDLLSAAKAFGQRVSSDWSRWRPEVVHTHYLSGGLAGLVAAGDARTPMVASFHQPSAPDERIRARVDADRRRRSYERLVSSQASAVLVGSIADIDGMLALGVKRTVLAVVPDAVDEQVFRPDAPAAPRGDRPRLISVGPDIAAHADAMRTLAMMPQAELVAMTAVGCGREPKPTVAALRRLAADAKVGDRVTGVTGDPTAESRAAWYRSAAMVLCAGRDRFSATAAVEAMACALPVVGYDVPALADIVVDGVTGDLVPVGDVRALGAAARRLLRSESLRQQYGASGYDRARHAFSLTRAVAQHEAVYERVAFD